MPTKKLKPATIAEYIASAPIELQDRLQQLHECIIKAAPGAIEGLKWNMPAYSYQKILVAFAFFKNHIGFFPMQTALKAFSKDLAKYKTSSASIQFPHDQKLPLPLIRKIVRFRVKESKEGVIKWRS